eukprot:CAMPEP_0204188046 /NCGR_PEP_ID=MMETSP0361-20130328/57329_1 /ASSEMBLY_ACC=CAM_ASM_000343 /TAXON_ID=268821 /ORGANISM="Scrippsiella Hangoei, Strain SHTV-5" /LENGTH=147 /DNA_ID=CAMNT_0051148543 /DNA_START=101 /DNA_END=545 /DNA_ORIENTATION=-
MSVLVRLCPIVNSKKVDRAAMYSWTAGYASLKSLQCTFDAIQVVLQELCKCEEPLDDTTCALSSAESVEGEAEFARTRTPEPSMTPTQPLTPFCKSSRACPNFSSKVVDMAAICFWAARCVANNTTSSELIFRISLREVLDCVRVRM